METAPTIEILLVEDNQHDAALTMRALTKNNVSNALQWVKDGQEALDFLFCQGAYVNRRDAKLPKMIFLDINMPKVNGLEVLERLKADQNLRRIPIVIMSSSAEEPDVDKAYRLGVNSYVVKPIAFDNYAETVAQVGRYWTQANRPAHG